MEVYVADFETSNDGINAHVWLWCACDLNENIVAEGTNIDTFIEWALRETKTVYFHNLKYDGSYIFDYLLKNDYKHVTTRKVEDMQFSSLIDDYGQWYGAKVVRGVNRKRSTLHLLDSLKKINATVANIAKRFKLPFQKGEIDHNIYRPVGYVPTAEELDYCYRDVKIVASGLRVLYDQGLTKITTSSDALHDFKQTLQGQAYNNLFPTLPDDFDTLARKAYRGGYVYANPLYQYQHDNKQNFNCGRGKVYDVNSLYPFIMLSRLLPFGKPLFFEGKYKKDKVYNLYTQIITVDLRLKKDHFPTIQTKGMLKYTEDKYIINTDEPLTLTLNNIDIELMFDHYDVEVYGYHGGLKYMSAEGMFDTYIHKWREIKERSEGGEREASKLMLNSLYGKFGTNPVRRNKIPYLDNGVLKYETSEPVRDKPLYVPVASFITSWARDYVIRTAQRYYRNVAYIDTDSMHIIGDITPDIEIHDTHFGAWKEELQFEHSRYIRPKTYIEIHEDKITVKCAGMPPEAKKHVTFDNFIIGSGFVGKLRPKMINGGMILIPDDFTIKP